MTFQIKILHPKAADVLQTLAELQVISIKEVPETDFLKVVKKLRTKAAKNPPTLKEISIEVERVREKQNR